MTKAERIEKMKEDLARMTQIEKELYAAGHEGREVNIIAGMDEVGRGPLAGPVVTAAVVLPRDFDLLGVNDSKKLTEKRREEMYKKIMDCAIEVNIGIRDNMEIDRVNILNATKEAMADAVNGLKKRPDVVLIDALTIEGTDVPQIGIVKGDAKSVSIAAASIIAKVTRDHMMIDYAEKYPGYAFENNKGYGTKAHYEGLDRLGPCPIHRRSFLVKYFENKK
ncbi:MAG: ribonuclease HII [Anaerovoracaceae bacterium]|nr:ribonuclease HII [Bacillota bacterium]MDY2671030.1 ribonuclease HII [Anaerovoracaceae bacterium]